MPEDAQGTRNLELGEVREGSEQRALQARAGHAGDCPTGREGWRGVWVLGVCSP